MRSNRQCPIGIKNSGLARPERAYRCAHARQHHTSSAMYAINIEYVAVGMLDDAGAGESKCNKRANRSTRVSAPRRPSSEIILISVSAA